uniref:Caspase-9 long chain n=1 Tax=Aster yellows phytoplasma TaxID=35779 RepID=Q849C5_ASTYP|nr:caspase-9 long chain [Aster yellows phytoplasma]
MIQKLYKGVYSESRPKGSDLRWAGQALHGGEKILMTRVVLKSSCTEKRLINKGIFIYLFIYLFIYYLRYFTFKSVF